MVVPASPGRLEIPQFSGKVAEDSRGLASAVMHNQLHRKGGAPAPGDLPMHVLAALVYCVGLVCDQPALPTTAPSLPQELLLMSVWFSKSEAPRASQEVASVPLVLLDHHVFLLRVRLVSSY